MIEISQRNISVKKLKFEERSEGAGFVEGEERKEKSQSIVKKYHALKNRHVGSLRIGLALDIWGVPLKISKKTNQYESGEWFFLKPNSRISMGKFGKWTS